MTEKSLYYRAILVALTLNSLISCSATETKNVKNDDPWDVKNDDPWEGWNRSVQAFNEDVDNAILKPMANGYLWATSDAVDEGVSNFFSNINDIGVTVNDLFQFKMVQSGMDASRFVINTTAGVVGVFDVAKHLDLPKHNEDFGQTLGFWGVPSGNYLVLPFIGASSPRDAVGLIGDALLNPLTYTFLFAASPAVTAGSMGISTLEITDTRAGLMATEKMIDEASVDRYQFIKNAYRQHREHLVHDGNVSDDSVDLLEEEETENGISSSKNKTPVLQTVDEHLKKNNDYKPRVINNSRQFLELSAPK